MSNKPPIMVSIMPTVDGMRSPGYHVCGDVASDLPDEEIGEVVGDCLRKLREAGAFVGDNIIKLEIVFA